MGKYGFSTYGVSPYGQVSSNTVSYTSNLESFQPTYKTVKLSWDNIAVPSGDTALTYWKIIKSTAGAPDNANDGRYVVGGSFPISQFTYTDIETFYPAGTETTYSFWVFNGTNWFFCGDTSAIVVTDTSGTTLSLARMLPGVWTASVKGFGGATSEPDTNTDLYNFLSNFGYYYDYLRQRVSIVNNLSDFRFYPTAMLSTAIGTLGFSYEPTLGDQYHRTLYRAAETINLFKGTRAGIRAYITALTHYQSALDIGTNLLLDYNQSSFEESTDGWSISITPTAKTITNTQVVSSVATITSAAHGFAAGNAVTVSVTNNNSVYNGDWIISSVTTNTFSYSVSTTTLASAANTGTVIFDPLSARKYANSAAELGSALLAPSDSSLLTPAAALVDSIYKPRTAGYGLICSNGTSDITLSSYNSTDTITRTVPIIEGRSYQFFGYARKSSSNTSNTSTIKAAIRWFDRLGAEITTTYSSGNPVYGTALTFSTSWQYFESSNVDTAIVAPRGAVYAGVTLVVSSPAANDRFFIDFLSFNEYPGLIGDFSYGSGKAIYEDARTIKINLSGVRTNYLPNPSFEDSKGGTLGGWSAYNGTITTDTTSPIVGTKVCKYTALSSNSNLGTLSTNWIQLNPDTIYTFSAYVRGLSSAQTAFARVDFTSPYDETDQVSIKQDSVTNEYYFNVADPVDMGTYTVAQAGWGPTSIQTSTATVFTPTTTPSFKIGDRVRVYETSNNTIWAEGIVLSITSGVSILFDTLSASGISITNATLTLAKYQYRTKGNDVTLSGTQYQRVSVTFKTPQYTTDGGFTSVKAHIFFPNMAAYDYYLIDGCLLEKGSTLLPFFWGSGGVSDANTNLNPTYNVLGDYFTPAEDCQWEKKVRSNFIDNPSFESGSTTGYTATSGTLTSVTYTAAGVPAMFGTYVGKVVASSVFSNINTTFLYPSNISLSGSPTTTPFPYGGESITASAYVYGPAGTYTMSIGSTTSSFTIPANTWTRIFVTAYADRATTTTPSISVNVAYGGSSGTWYVDGVQAEFGDNPSPFVDPADTATLQVTHPRDDTKKIYTTLQPATGGSRSYYWPRLVNKLARLGTNLIDFTPLGSSWSIVLGEHQESSTQQNLKSSSFEESLYGWTPTTSNTKATRAVGRGALYSEVGALGSSWAKLTNTTTSETSFGIYQNSLFVKPGTPYTCATAAQITSSADAGIINVQVDWYDSTNTFISSVNKNNSISTTKRWQYANVVNSSGVLTAPTNAAYAKVTLTYTPTSRTSTNSVLLDRVVFREIG